eukprot:1156235-Pelagomonas_calceolata.AAC.12
MMPAFSVGVSNRRRLFRVTSCLASLLLASSCMQGVACCDTLMEWLCQRVIQVTQAVPETACITCASSDAGCASELCLRVPASPVPQVMQAVPAVPASDPGDAATLCLRWCKLCLALALPWDGEGFLRWLSAGLQLHAGKGAALFTRELFMRGKKTACPEVPRILRVACESMLLHQKGLPPSS